MQDQKSTSTSKQQSDSRSQSDSRYFLGIDFGTSGCRAIVINPKLQTTASAFVEYPACEKLVIDNSSYNHEQDPQLWWSSFIELMSQLSSQCDLTTISHLALDATSGTVLLANPDGSPISHALMYNDARATIESDEIQTLVPDNAAVHGTSSGIAKMLWLKRHYQPQSNDRYLHQADWLVGQLTGNYAITDYNNALKSGLDITTKQWQPWLQQIGIQSQQLPHITAPGTDVGIIQASVAQQTGLSPQLKIVSGCTDSTAAVIATGANNIGDAITSIGSTLVVKILSDRVITNSKYGIYSQPYQGRYLVGGSSNSGAAVLKHFFSTTQMQQMTRLINPATSTGLNYYPLLENGERFPISDPNYPTRLSPRPDTDIEFFKGMLEGIAEIEFQCYQRLKELGCPDVKKIYNVGGGSQNEIWTEIRQSRLQIPILSCTNTEAAFGSALLAQSKSIQK